MAMVHGRDETEVEVVGRLPVGADGAALHRLPTVRRRQRRAEVKPQQGAPIQVYTEGGNLTQAAKQWIFRAIGFSRHESGDGKPNFERASAWLRENGLDLPALVIKRVYYSLPDREAYELFDKKTCQEERVRAVSAMAMKQIKTLDAVFSQIGDILQDKRLLAQKAQESPDLHQLVKSLTALVAAHKELSEIVSPKAPAVNVFSEKTAILPFAQTVLPPESESSEPSNS